MAAQTPSLGILPGTASLLHNNLACSSGGWLCSVHNSVMPGGGKLVMHKLSAASKEGPEVTQAMSIRYLELPFGPVLVVSSTKGTKIYNEDATLQLYFAPLTDQGADLDVLKHHQGACLVPATQHIVIGTSKGSLSLVQAVAADQFIPLPESLPSSAAAPGDVAIVDVCYCAAVDTVVSAHANGELRTWVPASNFANVAVIPAVGQAPVRVGSLGLQLLVAYGPGTICFFDARTYELQAELTAHARWTTAVTVREDTNQIVTVGEDTVLNLWQVDPSSGQVSLHHTSVVSDKLLTGVALLANGAAVTAYDSADIYHVVM
mmetsp:Transcript_93237/g.240969  ORF Transcript_93237/g.240969 Transcript_93237/m.240969 type:complete len:319 (-) Transcript_93237:91-1047(-)